MAAVVKGLEIKILGLSAGIRRYEFTAHLGMPGNRLSEIESGRLHNILYFLVNGSGNLFLHLTITSVDRPQPLFS